MTTPRMLRSVLATVLVLSLSACGFHLRNALVLPSDLGPVKVMSVDRYSPLAESLARALTRAGATPAAEGEPSAVLDLQVEQWGDTPASVDEFGRAQEFTLRYAVVFEVRRADGSRRVPRQTIELARDYVSVPTASRGTEGEREILQREMQREMVAAVLRRIDAVSKATPATADGAGAGMALELAGAATAPAPAVEVAGEGDTASDEASMADEAAVEPVPQP